jgi:anti-sigma regulatory factor (Ser/Thr protein kinase)
MDKSFSSYQIEDRSFVSYIKRIIHNEVVSKKRFSETQVGQVDIIISELASNLVKHAGGEGELLYRFSGKDGEPMQFELVCVDSGPGIADPSRMIKDGESTTNTLGHGIGAVFRLSDFTQLYSLPEWGTVFYTMVATESEKYQKRASLDVDVRGLCVHKPRETFCGDGYEVKRTQNLVKIFLGDGLGHGPHANEAVLRACEFFAECEEENPVEILRGMHEKVRKTRGLVGTVATFDRINNLWKVCGIGNIATRLYTGIVYKNYVSYNGALGLTMPNSLKESVFFADRNQHLVMTSDGIRSRWELTKYPSLFKYDILIMAAILYKDYSRKTDDSSVLIAKVI